jgi:hypothetical protein
VLRAECGPVSELILDEFERPDNRLAAWMQQTESLTEYETGEKPVCPQCGSKELLLGGSRATVPCPWCHAAVLEVEIGFIS